MPMYATKCESPTCGHAFDDFRSMKAASPPCPKCKGTTRVDWTRQGAPKAPATDLHGSRQVPADVHAQPHEVERLRRLYGEGVGHCWQADGSVRFANPSEAKRFYRKDEEIRGRFRELRAAGKIRPRTKRPRNGVERVG